MIIVSQDEKSIYNFNNIKSVDVIENAIFITDDILADRGAFLGEYKTEERAKEVLQEIISKYAEYATLKNDVGDIRQIYDLPKFYRMPLE